MLFVDHSELERTFEKRLLLRARYKLGSPPHWFRNAHKDFLDACREDCGLGAEDYPFTSGDRGFRAFKKWMKEAYLPRHLSRWVRDSYGPAAGQAQDYAEGDGESKRLLGPYKVWQLDEVDLDVNARCTLPAPKRGEISAPLHRLSELRLVDVGSGAVLSRRLVVSKKVAANDVLIVLWDAISGPPEVPKVYPSPPKPEADYPVNLFPELRFALVDLLYLDNALAHLAACRDGSSLYAGGR
ncbi:hypothetical protein [Piscinibacter gummiphilus]|uniref:Transposase n=1 Tax=Piscinibacter gummiphilus TaxID=946333 RepID=A0ABZ0CLP2_9BURK|nr:hypothetical protein [Piscinibacter gummiphilus]WOB05898.1 hypothetical protein RXV79_13305 [Piscinibacter gummiphilus]